MKFETLILMISFITAIILGIIIIPILRKLKVSQQERAEGPKSHLNKKGTPTMGGIISIIAITLLSLGVMLIYYKNKQVDVIKGIIPLLFATLGFGIVGFIDKSKSINTLSDMLKIQSYRGPDDSGVYFDEKSGVHFGHNRLSIQDLSSHGHQPFVSDCGNYIIVFNGEVYNFKIIKTELQNLGYNFISNSDTEVMLYSYKECIDKFVGMFAFAILDKVEDKLVLVRDRAGVKPLYYYIYENQFMFSSEIKSFHKHPKFKKEQNFEVLPYFFQFGYIPAPYTIFQNCFKLEAGIGN